MIMSISWSTVSTIVFGAQKSGSRFDPSRFVFVQSNPVQRPFTNREIDGSFFRQRAIASDAESSASAGITLTAKIANAMMMMSR